MISFPLNAVLTAAFSLTALICLFNFRQCRKSAEAVSADDTPSGAALSDEQVIDVNHLVMSVAMILMVWVMVPTPLLWIQVVLFCLLAASLLLNWKRARTNADRADVATHILLDIAMIWMLAAMPLLMGMDHGGGGGHEGHGGGGGGMAMTTTPTPAWADLVNLGFIVISALIALHWLTRIIMRSRYRLHAVCHLIMSTAMALMLYAMNM